MKKFLAISCLALLGLSQTAKAQDEAGIYGGITYSVNSTWLFDEKLWDDPNYKTEKTWKTSPGLAVGFKFNKTNALQVEFIRQKQGAHYTIVDDLDNDREVGQKRIDLTYTAIPVLYKVTSGDKVRFNFHFGPQFSFLNSGSEINEYNSANNRVRVTASSDIGDLTAAQITATGATPSVTPTGDAVLTFPSQEHRWREKEDFNDTDIALVFGLGLEFDIVGGLYATTNLRFNYGFKDIRNDEWVKREEARNYYNRRNNVLGGLQVGLHYIFKY